MTEDFINIVEPAIKWLNENANPHAKIIIDICGAELVYGQMAHRTEEFIKG